MQQFSSGVIDFEVDFDKKTLYVSLKNHIKQNIRAVISIKLEDDFTQAENISLYYDTEENRNEINKIRDRYEDKYHQHITDILRPIAQQVYFEAHFNRKKKPVVIEDARIVTTPIS